MKFWLKKLGWSLVTAFAIITLTFALMKAIPGDPFSEERGLPKETKLQLMKHYGLDQPIWKQYIHYLKAILVWDLGPSLKYKGRSVNDIINKGFPVSVTLGLTALIIAIGVGIALGTASALYKNRAIDRMSTFFAVLGISVPSFLLATLLQYVFAIELGLFPVARWGSWWHIILPALSLAALPTAFIARLTRSNLVDVLHQDYIKTAKAKGLSQSMIIIRHALRNALLPVIAYIGQMATNILVGSLIIERIFGIPGLGQWFVMSVSNRDYSVIMGTTVFYSFLLLGCMLFVDLFIGIMDPRIRLRERR